MLPLPSKKYIFTIFFVIFLITGCSDKTNTKSGNGAKAPPVSGVGIDEKLLENLQLNTIESQSVDALPMETLEKVADIHAKAIWGSNVTRGMPLQLIDNEGEPVLYAFPFALEDSTIPDTNELIKQFSIHKGIDDSFSEFYSNLNMEVARYGTIYVSARKRDFPVRRVSHALHPYYYNAVRAILNTDLDTAKLKNLRYLPPHEFFEFQKDDTTIRLNTQMLMSEEQILKAVKEFANSPRTKSVSKNAVRSNIEQIEKAWKAYEKITPVMTLPPPPPPVEIEYKINRWQRIPAINWTRWCEPTAASMVFSYWDHYVPVAGIGGYPNYPRLIDYWLDHPSNGNNVPDILDPIADGLNIDVANNLKGYNWTVDKVIGDSNNDFAWNELVGHLHINHPVVWHVFGDIDHATAAFGYRILNGQKYVILYNTWSADPQQALAEWLYNDWDSVEVDRYRPGGKEYYRRLIIASPYGGETFHVGQWNEIKFNVHSHTDITKARIESSLDGGQTWSLVVETWVQPGWNRWWWKPTSTSNKARIRIKGMADDRTYLGGHGSFMNFIIQ